MSHNKIVATLALFFSLFFLSIAGMLMLIKLFLGFKSMLKKGVSKNAYNTNFNLIWYFHV